MGRINVPGDGHLNRAWRIPKQWHDGPECIRGFLTAGDGFIYACCNTCMVVANLEAIGYRQTWTLSGMIESEALEYVANVGKERDQRAAEPTLHNGG